MKTYLTVSVALLTGMAIGGFAVQSLHAQGKKAYTVTENEVLDAKLAPAFGEKVVAAQATAGGRNLKTGGGKVTAMEGTAPARVAIVEWESLAKAEAWFKSKEWNDLAPEREKALKTIRRYVVEER